jgi:hypothetical protein
MIHLSVQSRGDIFFPSFGSTQRLSPLAQQLTHPNRGYLYFIRLYVIDAIDFLHSLC